MKLEDWNSTQVELVYSGDKEVMLNIFDLEPGVTYVLLDGTKLKTQVLDGVTTMEDKPVIGIVGVQ